jgi:hypothetical protein
MILLQIELGTAFEFKFVVVNGEKVVRWEVLPSNLNRRYKVEFKRVTLEGREGDPEGHQTIINRFDDDSFVMNEPGKYYFTQ